MIMALFHRQSSQIQTMQESKISRNQVVDEAVIAAETDSELGGESFELVAENLREEAIGVQQGWATAAKIMEEYRTGEGIELERAVVHENSERRHGSPVSGRAEMRDLERVAQSQIRTRVEDQFISARLRAATHVRGGDYDDNLYAFAHPDIVGWPAQERMYEFEAKNQKLLLAAFNVVEEGNQNILRRVSEFIENRPGGLGEVAGWALEASMLDNPTDRPLLRVLAADLFDENGRKTLEGFIDSWVERPPAELREAVVTGELADEGSRSGDWLRKIVKAFGQESLQKLLEGEINDWPTDLSEKLVDHCQDLRRDTLNSLRKALSPYYRPFYRTPRKEELTEQRSHRIHTAFKDGRVERPGKGKQTGRAAPKVAKSLALPTLEVEKEKTLPTNKGAIIEGRELHISEEPIENILSKATQGYEPELATDLKKGLQAIARSGYITDAITPLVDVPRINWTDATGKNHRLRIYRVNLAQLSNGFGATSPQGKRARITFTKLPDQIVVLGVFARHDDYERWIAAQ